jgi:hypothetical protein
VLRCKGNGARVVVDTLVDNPDSAPNLDEVRQQDGYWKEEMKAGNGRGAEAGEAGRGHGAGPAASVDFCQASCFSFSVVGGLAAC